MYFFSRQKEEQTKTHA